MALRAIVAGGGIAGLTAAYVLSRRARRAGLRSGITLIERRDRLGGVIRTEHIDDFVVEAGPDSFVTTKPWAMELCEELGIADRLQETSGRRRVYVLQRGRLRPIPDGLTMMVPTRLGEVVRSPLFSPLGKLRMGLEPVLPRRRTDGDESVRSFASRRLGTECYERLIEPLIAGIYGGDGGRLSLQATLPIWNEWEQDYGSLTRAAWARRSPGGSAQSIFVTPKGGLIELVAALERHTEGVDFRLNLSVHEIRSHSDGFTVRTDVGQTLEAQIVIVAAPAHAAAAMLSKVDPALATLLDGIEYAASATVSLAYRTADLGRALDGHGYLIPRREQRRALACTWTSGKFPHRAPDGRTLLRVFFGQPSGESSSIEDEQVLLRAAQHELKATLGLEAEPLFARVCRWPRALPQYTLGHVQRVREIRAKLADHPGLFLAGAAYDGVGIPDCVRGGRRAADQALAHMGLAEPQG